MEKVIAILKMLSGVTAAVSRRRQTATFAAVSEDERKAGCSPQELMPVWGVFPHHAKQLDIYGRDLVEQLRAGSDSLADIASSLKKIQELLLEFSPGKPVAARDMLLWTLLQDACCGTEFEKPDNLWHAFLPNGEIPQ